MLRNADLVLDFLFDRLITDDYYEDYENREEELRCAFGRYATATGEEKECLDWLLTSHADICKQSGKTELLRRHNSFVLRFVAGKSPGEIARFSNTSKETVHRDIRRAFETMMIIAFGIDGMFPMEEHTVCNSE